MLGFHAPSAQPPEPRQNAPRHDDTGGDPDADAAGARHRRRIGNAVTPRGGDHRRGAFVVDIEGLLNYYNEDYVLLSDVMTPLDRMRKEVEYITQILGLTPGMKVLDLGCGYGRIAQELATAGMHVTGVDLVPAMIDKAKERAAAAGLAIDYRLGDFSRLPSLGRFDAVIMWFFSFGYGDETAHLKSLRNACAALRKGGLLLFDQYNTHVLAAENHPTMVDRGDTLFIHRPRPDLEAGRWGVDRIVVRDGSIVRSSFSCRCYTPPELRSMCQGSGFRLARFLSEETSSYLPESRKLVTVAMK